VAGLSGLLGFVSIRPLSGGLGESVGRHRLGEGSERIGLLRRRPLGRGGAQRGVFGGDSSSGERLADRWHLGERGRNPCILLGGTLRAVRDRTPHRGRIRAVVAQRINDGEDRKPIGLCSSDQTIVSGECIGELRTRERPRIECFHLGVSDREHPHILGERMFVAQRQRDTSCPKYRRR
jgi:hypothetical protein